MPLGSTAYFSPDSRYRYRLERKWSDALSLHFVMLNPSTADEHDDDPTIRRCIGFAKRDNFGGIVVSNLFALRSTDPRELRSHGDRYSSVEAHLKQIALEGSTVGCYGVTRSGEPRHPLYLRADTPLENWLDAKPAEAAS